MRLFSISALCGDWVGLKLDMGARTATYYINGRSHGVVFSRLPSYVWPAASSANTSGSNPAVYNQGL